MSRKEGKDYLYLIWKEPITRRNYIVGQLSRNGQYEFCYGYEVKNAIEKVYKSDILFPTFSSRLPDRKRRGIERILSKYGLKTFDEYKLKLFTLRKLGVFLYFYFALYIALLVHHQNILEKLSLLLA